MFAIEDEIGDGKERAAKFARRTAVQAGFGAGGIIVCEHTRTLEGARIAHQGRDLLRAHAVESFFLENSAHHATARGAISFEVVNEREDDLDFFEITEHQLSLLQKLAREIEQIIT